MTARAVLAWSLLMCSASAASAQDGGVPPASELVAPEDADAASAPDAGAGDASMTGAAAADSETGDPSSPVEAPLEGEGSDEHDPLPAWARGVGGPAAPSALAPLPPPPRRGELDLWVQGDGRAEGWHLLVRASEGDRWRDVCLLPCRVSPDAGSWYVGVWMPGHREAVRAEPSPFELSHHGVLSIRYYDRTVQNVVGGVMIALGILGIVAGSAILITSESYFGVLGLLPLVAGSVLGGVGIGLAAARTFLRVTWSAP
jgi:hypothetical protein